MIGKFLHESITIDLDRFKKDAMRLSRCQRPDKKETRSVSIKKLMQLLRQYKEGKYHD